MHRTGPETRGFRPPESWAPADLIAVAHIRIIPFEFPSGRSLRSSSRPTLTFHKTTEFLNLPRQLATAAIPLRDTSARSPAGFWRKGTNRHSTCQADGPPASTLHTVIPARAGIQRTFHRRECSHCGLWSIAPRDRSIPALAEKGGGRSNVHRNTPPALTSRWRACYSPANVRPPPVRRHVDRRLCRSGAGGPPDVAGHGLRPAPGA